METNLTIIWWILAGLLFVAVDMCLYCLAKSPERECHWWSDWPGSGLIAIIKYGRDK